MAQFIEPYRPRLLTLPQTKGALAPYKPATPIIAALGVVTELRVMIPRSLPHGDFFGFAHDARMVNVALKPRNDLLRYFLVADQASRLLYGASPMFVRLERKTSIAMIGAMLSAFGCKSDKELLAGMVEIIEADATARATGFWPQLNVTPTTLTLACRKLIATSKFVPKPAELVEACRQADGKIASAIRYCDELTEFIMTCDALLLEFAPDQWREPYLLPQYQSTVQRMLDLHRNVGDHVEESFSIALERAMTEFPEPKAIEQPTSVAACAQRPAKRTRKAKPRAKE